jgi:hypothetical protein
MSNDTHKQAAEFLERQLEAENPSLDADLRRSLASLGAHIAERRVEAAKAPQPAKILHFPLPFAEDTRAVSNVLARCALFAAVKERQHFTDWVYIGEIDGVKIEFKGEQLTQEDHDTLLQLIKMARHEAFGVDVSVPVKAVLRGLGRHTHKSQRQQVCNEVERLAFGFLRFTPRGLPSYVGHLIEDASTPQDQAVLPEHRRALVYRLNAKFSRFYDEAHYTLFDRKERLALGGSPLAKWLHLWIIGNAEQYPHKVETLRNKCGSKTKDLKHFRETLRKALDLLKTAGIITAWRIDDADLVHIERTPSPAQLAHIAKKARKPRAKRQPGGRLKKASDFL